MKHLARRVLAAAGALACTTVGVVVVTAAPALAATTPGIDVSHYQGAINWTSVRNAGIRFAFIKATEGVSILDSRFAANYVGAYNAGVIRGAYHFARPAASSGAAQANYVADHGGAWSADSRTLPAALDLEAGCAGLSQASMRSWIQSFLNQYRARTGRYAIIYTTTSWWTSCTGNWTGPWSTSPLWIARWASSPGTLPAGAPFWSFWQYTSSGSVSGVSGAVDRDYWNGTVDRLVALANNT
jgi:GH25 family lysozyme M1 (1,4-beta-N-acetylmuramidase)